MMSSMTGAGYIAGGIAGDLRNSAITKCFNTGIIKTNASVSAGGIVGIGGTITSSNNVGDVIGEQSAIVGEIVGSGSVNNTNYYLSKDNNANANGATQKSQTEMSEIMSVQNFVILMNSYVVENNSDPTKTKLRTWTVENGYPVFANN